MVRGFNLDAPTADIRRSLAVHFDRLVQVSGKRLKVTPQLCNACDRAAAWLTSANTYGLKIMGGNGTGKSTLLEAIQCTVAECMERQPDRKRILMARYLSTEIVEAFKANDQMCEMFYRFRLLAIDEVGWEALKVVYYGNEILPVGDIIHRRADKRLATIITTNLDQASIMQRYGPRIHDRMRDMTTIILDGKSNRGHDGV